MIEQEYMDYKGGNPVSAPGVGGNSPWTKKLIETHTLEWPSGLVCQANCKKKNGKKNKEVYQGISCSILRPP